MPDEIPQFGTILAHVEGKCAGLFNRVVIATLGFTMLAQHLQFLWDLRARLQIAGIGIACDQPQGLLFATAGNQNRWVRTAEALRQVQQAFDAVVFPLVAPPVSLLSLPHVQADLEHLLQPLVASLSGGNGSPEPTASSS